MLHISEIADRRVKDVRDELKEGQQILVKCIGKEGNKIKLSRKAVLRDEERKAEAASAGEVGLTQYSTDRVTLREVCDAPQTSFFIQVRTLPNPR